jgi:catechol 2,3-dioxygenase-like lactoylglutathione lyase family enzyme
VAVYGINHIAFRTPDVPRLKAFYEELFGGEPLTGSHDPLRVGPMLFVFFPSEGRLAEDPDELAFDTDLAGFEDAYERAKRLGALQREPVEPTHWSRAFLVRDPDGRRIEVTYDDRGVYWQE